MSMPSPETLERDPDKLWVKDSELIRRLGVPEKQAREAIRMLERMTGFPKKQKLWGDRRYWPAVKQFMDKQYGGRQSA
ncbi:winged helix-turn-helix domain-containing protein [Bradyrhizobium japonicum]|uniref:winged helix-turn-helix domain-containing protein n=1 Tax=Bradyrhizobium japonicum TaxID=375 RepID=UPI00200E56DC|nr:winged helix-turn-helix domain-containing protein [Bradyrhizobium japonicum]UQD69251.1 winged helix-turn-helix domain-containing protein [Bradyrhizobium japonicum]WAX24514.1 winged helix-turn-helix domain-containing protein [Bradyrhizobium phage ppBjS10J-1]